MDDPIQTKLTLNELKYEKSFSSTKNADTNKETTISIKDPDTMLSMIVLLLACLALSTLAHVFV